MLAVRLLPRHAEARNGDNGAACIGKVVEGIGHYGDGAGNNACGQLAGAEHGVEKYTQASAEHAVFAAHLGVFGILCIFYEYARKQSYHAVTPVLIGITVMPGVICRTFCFL